MTIAYELARQIGPIELLPAWLDSPAECAGLVLLVEDKAMGRVLEAWQDIRAQGYSDERLAKGFAEGFGELAEDPSSAPSIGQALQRQNILLRLWSGCMSAAKTISDGTQNGPNTSEARASRFLAIDSLAMRDPVYRAGVVAAPTLKKLRGQSYSFDGVPADSPVRMCPA